jgi:hypothetical protein
MHVSCVIVHYIRNRLKFTQNWRIATKRTKVPLFLPLFRERHWQVLCLFSPIIRRESFSCRISDFVDLHGNSGVSRQW